MKVHSIHGEVPARALPPREGPGIRTQADIAERFRPREDVSYKIFRDEVPMFLSGKPLCGPDVDKKSMVSFIRNYMRSRSIISEWFLAIGDEYTGEVRWNTITSGRDLIKYNTLDIATIITDALTKTTNAAAVRVSTNDGILVGTTKEPPLGFPSLTVWYTKR